MTWQFARRGNKIFVYRNGGMTPAFTFARRTEKGHFIGHGKYFMSLDEIKRYIERDGNSLIVSASCKSDSFA